VDAHVFSEAGILRLDAIESGRGGGGGAGGGGGDGAGGGRGQDAQAAGMEGVALKFPPEGYVSISAPGRADISASMVGDTVGPLPPGTWARKLDQMCLEVRELLKPRHIATREEQDSRAEEWTSSTPHNVSDFDEEEVGDEEDDDSNDLPAPPQMRA